MILMKKDTHKLFPKKMSKSLWCLKKSLIFATAFREVLLAKEIAEIAQLVEHDLAKVGVAGSSPVFRSFIEKHTSS